MRYLKTRTNLPKALMLIALFMVTVASAQGTAQERAARLRSQLAEVEAKQTELQTRLRQLEEDLKPENIERSLAGVGSTRPEELREQRRRQMYVRKKGVQAELDLLAASRTRLEMAIVRADTESYHQSAGVSKTPATNAAKSRSTNPRGRQIKKQKMKRKSPIKRASTTKEFGTPEQ